MEISILDFRNSPCYGFPNSFVDKSSDLTDPPMVLKLEGPATFALVTDWQLYFSAT